MNLDLNVGGVVLKPYMPHEKSVCSSINTACPLDLPIICEFSLGMLGRHPALLGSIFSGLVVIAGLLGSFHLDSLST